MDRFFAQVCKEHERCLVKYVDKGSEGQAKSARGAAARVFVQGMGPLAITMMRH